MTYLATSINESPVIAEKAGADITDVRGRAVKYDTAGAVVLAGAGEAAIGVGIMTDDAPLAAGDDLTIQHKDIGLVFAGAAIAKGAELAANANGELITATAGQFVVAIALQAATAKGEYIKAKLAGYHKPAAAE